MSVLRLPNTARALLAAACTAVLAVGLAGAPADASTGKHVSARAAHHWKIRVGAESPHRAIQTMGFYPRNIWVDQGDTVTWVARSAEIHTVTFLGHTSPCPPTALCAPPMGFNPSDMRQSTPGGTGSYDGSSYYNSGVMSNATGDTGPLPPFVVVQRHYRLTFPDTLAPGTYTYFCLVHGKAMRGHVIVQEAGTHYPFSQRQYNHRSRRQASRDIADGHHLWAQARRQAARLTKKNGPTVLVGAMDDRAMVMRFIRGKTRIRVGDSVTFRATGMAEPHTVTFGGDETGCGSPPCNPEMRWNVAVDGTGNEVADYPGRNGGFGGRRTDLNTGLMLGAPPAITHLPSTLTVTFTQAGRFDYTCALHDYMGMVGKVVVGHRNG